MKKNSHRQTLYKKEESKKRFNFNFIHISHQILKSLLVMGSILLIVMIIFLKKQIFIVFIIVLIFILILLFAILRLFFNSLRNISNISDESQSFNELWRSYDDDK